MAWPAAMRDIACGHRQHLGAGVDAQPAQLVDVGGNAVYGAIPRQAGPHPVADRHAARPVVGSQHRVGAVRGPPAADAGRQVPEDRFGDVHAVGGRAEHRQRRGDGIRGVGDVQTQPDDHDRCGRCHLRQDACKLPRTDEDIVGPLEPRLEARDLIESVHHRDAGEQWQPAPCLAGHGTDADTDRQRDLRPRRRRPASAVPATTRGLGFGEQYRTVDVLARGGTGQQVDVGGAGFVDDVDSCPERAGSDQDRSQPGDIEWVAIRHVIRLRIDGLIHHNDGRRVLPHRSRTPNIGRRFGAVLATWPVTGRRSPPTTTQPRTPRSAPTACAAAADSVRRRSTDRLRCGLRTSRRGRRV